MTVFESSGNSHILRASQRLLELRVPQLLHTPLGGNCLRFIFLYCIKWGHCRLWYLFDPQKVPRYQSPEKFDLLLTLLIDYDLPFFADSKRLDLFIGRTYTHLSSILYGKLLANTGFFLPNNVHWHKSYHWPCN